MRLAFCVLFLVLGVVLASPVAVAATISDVGVGLVPVSLEERPVDLTEGEDVKGESSKVHLDNGTCRFDVGSDYWIETSLVEPVITKFITSTDRNALTWTDSKVEMQYEYLDSKLKETIIISDPSISKLVFSIRCDVGDLVLNPDGSITLENGGYRLIDLEAPTAEDRDGKPVSASYSLNGSTLTLTLGKVDAAQYPIVVDPTYIVATGSGLGSSPQQRNLERSSDGTLWCAYLVGSPAEVYVKYSADDGQTWSTAEQATNNGRAKSNVGMASAPNGDLWCYWKDGPGTIYGVWRVSGAWGAIEPCKSGGGTTSQQPSAAFDSAGGIHLVFNEYNITGAPDTDQSIGYQYRDPVTGWENWATGREIVCHNAGYSQALPCVTVDSNDDVHVTWAYRGSDLTYPTKHQVGYRKKTGDTWGTIEVLTDLNDTQYEAVISIDSSDVPHITWNGKLWAPYPSEYQVIYSNRTGGSWNTPEVVSTSNDTNYGTSITLTTGDDVHIFWHGQGYGVNTGQYNIQHRVKPDGGSWGSITGITDSAYYQISASSIYARWQEIETGVPLCETYSGSCIVFRSDDAGGQNVAFHITSDLSWSCVILSLGDTPAERTAQQGASLTDIPLYGAGFTGATAVAFHSNGITVDDFDVESDNKILVDISVGATEVGMHDAEVTSPSGGGYLPDAFEVTEGSAFDRNPNVARVAYILAYIFAAICILGLLAVFGSDFSIGALILGAIAVVICVVGVTMIHQIIAG